jgi:hypothetical protein
MKPFNSNEAATYLNISRSTVRRLAVERLKPDGHTGSGRPYWHRATLDVFRLGLGLGDKRNAIAFETSLLPSITCDSIPDQDLLGRHVEVVSLVSSDLLLLLSELYAAIAIRQPADLVLPAHAVGCPTGLAVIRSATESGCNVVLRPTTCATRSKG